MNLDGIVLEQWVKIMEEEGSKLHTNTEVNDIEKQSNGCLKVKLNRGGYIDCDAVIWLLAENLPTTKSISKILMWS